jgi:hypothetical protein
MKKLVVLLAVSLMATSAFALLDPDANSLGVYFDTNGDVTSIAPALGFPPPPYQMYLILANPTFAAVNGFECTLEVTGGAHVIVGTVFPNAGINVQTAPQYAAGWDVPQPTSAATILATFTMNSYANVPGEVFLRAPLIQSIPSGRPNVIGDDVLVPVDYSSGDETMPVARIFGDDVVSEEVSSFGSVKSLFR